MEKHKITNRIQQLIDYYTNRSVKKFAESTGVLQQSFNRLFNIDKRNGNYPTPTTDMIVSIMEVYPDVNKEWLLMGEGNMFTNKTKEVPLSSNKEEQLFSMLKLSQQNTESQQQSIKILVESLKDSTSNNTKLIDNNTKLIDTNTKLAEKILDISETLSKKEIAVGAIGVAKKVAQG